MLGHRPKSGLPAARDSERSITSANIFSAEIALRLQFEPAAQIGNLAAQDILKFKHIIWTARIQDTEIIIEKSRILRCAPVLSRRLS